MTLDEIKKLNDSKPSDKQWMCNSPMILRSDSKPRLTKGTSAEDRHKIEESQIEKDDLECLGW